jgi:hypothetical protein
MTLARGVLRALRHACERPVLGTSCDARAYLPEHKSVVPVCAEPNRSSTRRLQVAS